MTNAELIKALRCCIVDFNSTQSRLCNECPYRIYADGQKACENKAKRDAADALEAAEQQIAELKADKKTLIKVIKDKSVFHATKDAMRIAELEARLPKSGEWIEVRNWLQIPQEERGTYRCSACGQVMKYPWNYCPNCGARMKGEEK